MSENTLADVKRLVNKGMVAVTSSRFAPESIKKKYKGGTSVLKMEKGSGS
jgi:hypothetical protein